MSVRRCLTAAMMVLLSAAPLTLAIAGPVEDLASKEPATRAAAARALWQKEKLTDQEAHALITALDDEDPLVSAYAAHALEDAPRVSEKLVAELVENLSDSDGRVRTAAATTLRALAPDPSEAMAASMGATSAVDPDAMAPLIELFVRGGKRSVPLMVEKLADRDVRYWAAIVLGELGPEAKDAAPALAKALADERPEVRLQVLIALGQIGASAESAVPAILKQLQAKETGVQYAAAFALGNIASPKATDALRKLQKTPDEFLKMLAYWGLARIYPKDPATVHQAVETLVQSLGSKDERLRQGAARGLAELKADPQIVLPALIKLLKDPNPAVRGNVIDAIVSLGPQVTPKLVDALQQSELRPVALATLIRLGPGAKSAAPALVALIRGEIKKGDKADHELLTEALIALAGSGGLDKTFEVEAQQLLAMDDPTLQRAAIFALGKIGPTAKAAIPRLRELLSSTDPRARLISLWALLQITPDDAEIIQAAVPALTEALTDSREVVRREAAAALGRIGPKAAASLPALEQLLRDRDSAVRQAAEQAIAAIGQGA